MTGGGNQPAAPWRQPALVALLLIQAAFLAKYGERIAGPTAAIIGCVLISAAFLVPAAWRVSIAWRHGPWIIAFWVAVCMAVLAAVPPWSFQVDRWDAVVYWWEALLRGDFPYSARTRMWGFPSPLPALQVVFAPFALWGDLAWATLAAWAACVAWVWRRTGALRLPQIALALLAPPVLWEIACRSTLLVNALLLLLFLGSTRQLLARPSLAGALTGLLLSTRLAMVVPLLGWGVGLWRLGHLRPATIARAAWPALLVFGITLSPLWLFWDMDAWTRDNPFAHHNRHMPMLGTALLLSLSLVLGAGRPRRVLANAAWVMLGFGVLYCANAVLSHGWQAAWYGHRADISYLLFAWPFLWTCLAIPEPATDAALPLSRDAAARTSTPRRA